MQTHVNRVFLPQYSGFTVDEVVSYFKSRVNLMEFLPDPRPLIKVPREFILNVSVFCLIKLQVIHTIDTDHFDKYIRAVMGERHQKIIKNTNQSVNILPIFEDKINSTNLKSCN